MLIFEKIPISDTKIENKYNTNNYPGLTPEEYINSVSLTHKDEWIKYFPDGSLVYKFTPYEVRILYEACKIGFRSFSRTLLYKDELDDIENRLNEFVTNNFKITDDGFFCRLSACSPKDGIHLKKVCNAKQMIDNLITSRRCFDIFERNIGKNLNLYISIFNRLWDEKNEFRVFVYKGKITAITQYAWCKDFGWSKELLYNIINMIIEYVSKEIILIATDKLCDRFVVDVIFVKDKIELIEFNSFGMELSSGSGLFEWKRDCDILYGNGNNIYIRYTFDDSEN